MKFLFLFIFSFLFTAPLLGMQKESDRLIAKKEEETKKKTTSMIRELVSFTRIMDADNVPEDFSNLAAQKAGKLSKELAELGKKNPKIVLPLIGESLFHAGEFGRVFLMDSLLEMKEDSALAYPYIKEISSIESGGGGPNFRYRRWLAMVGFRPVEIPLEIKVAALRFSAKDKEFFSQKIAKEEELIKLGKDKGPELEKLLLPFLRDENKEVSSSAKKILDKIQK